MTPQVDPTLKMLILNVKKSCIDVYRQCFDNLEGVTEEKKTELELLIMQNPKEAYKFHDVKDTVEKGANNELLENIVSDLCNGNNNVNKAIKSFLVEKEYIKFDEGNIVFTDKMRLHVLDGDMDGGFVKRDKADNIRIAMYEGAIKDVNLLAVKLGHEICHQMIEHKYNTGNKVFIAPECEALCDSIGLAAARGAGYDTQKQIEKNNYSYSREGKAEILEKCGLDPHSDDFMSKVDIVIDEANTYYMPEKLNKIAEIINNTVPITHKTAQKTIANQKAPTSQQPIRDRL